MCIEPREMAVPISVVATNTVFSVADVGNISRDGYSFGCWTDGVSVYQAGNDYLVGATNVTLTAVWNPIFLSVAYLIGDGASGVPPQQDPIPFNSSLSIASGEGISLDGQYFWGWSDGSQLYVRGSTMTNMRSDVTLTATWGDHPLPELPNTGRSAIADVLAALFALLGATLGVVLVRRTRRRGTLDA
jgi:LPXTG-motif cell wall-anchored protein